MATSSLNNPSASTPSNDMLSIVPCALCRVLPDSQLRILFANALFHTLFACPSDQKLPALCTMMHTPDAAKLKKKLVEFHIAKEPVFSMEFDAVCCDGTVKPLLLQCTKDNGSFILSFTDLSKQKDAEEKLCLWRKLCQTSSHQSGILLSYYDIHTHLLTFPFGEYSRIGRNTSCVFRTIPDDIFSTSMLNSASKNSLYDLFHSIEIAKSSGSCIIQAQPPDENGTVWFKVQYDLIASIHTEKGPHAILTFRNITNQREKEIAYEQWQQSYEEMRKDYFIYLECDLTNDRIEKLESQNSAITKLTKNFVRYTDYFDYVHSHVVCPDDQKRFEELFQRSKLIENYHAGHYRETMELRCMVKNGKHIWYSYIVQMLTDPYTKTLKAFVSITNINVQKQQILKLEENSRRDSLTGMLNRRTLMEEIQLLLLNFPYREQAFIFIDVDHFKHINDNYGHLFGDKVLKNLGMSLQQFIGPSDVCGRLGGDEFVAFLHEIPSSESFINQIARLSSTLCRKYDNGLQVSVCMGIAIAPKDGRTFQDLYRLSDNVLYEAKHIGPNNYVFYHGD
jgi:diguanylate cyclase (GGDEF)-like protein